MIGVFMEHLHRTWWTAACTPTADIAGRQHLRSASQRKLLGHSFLLPISPDDGHMLWWWCHLSDVQQSVTGRSRLLDPVSGTLCQMLSTFRQQLKTWLFRKSYPDIIIW